MHPLLHSPFLQALGYAIINSLWQFALLWLLYFAINTLFKLSSHQKYTTGLVLEFAGFVWFLETLQFYYNESVLFAQKVLIVHPQPFTSITSQAGTIKEKVFLLVLRSEQFFPYLSIAYLVLLFILTIRWLYVYTYTQKVRTEGLKEIEGTWKSFVQNLSLELNIGRKVEIFLSELVQTPLTIGFVKPLILIPVATINYLTPQQLEAVILHELAHIKRFDYLFNLLLAFIEACLFFNPFMQLIDQQVKKERENCCDDWVIKYEYSGASYAEALLQIASHQTHLPLLALKATDNKRLLINRIKRIIEKNERSFFNYKHQLLALLVMTTVLSSLSFLSPSKKIANGSNRSFHRNIIIEPIAAKVTNPLFNPVFFLTNSSKIEPEQKKKPEQVKLVKATIAVNRFSAPPAPPIAFPGAPAMEEEDKSIERSSNAALADFMPATTVNKLITIPKNDAKDLEKPRTSQVSSRTFLRLAAQPQTIERHLNSDELQFSKENKVNMEKVAIQLNKALQDIKAAKEQWELEKLQSLVRMGIRSVRKEIMNGTIDGTGIKADKLELLEKQIEKALDSIRLPNFTTTFNSDLNTSMPMSTVVYSIPPEDENRSFSYEYFRTPQVKIVNAPIVSSCKKTKKKNEKVVVVDEDEIKQDPIVAPPPAAPRRRTVYVIKI